MFDYSNKDIDELCTGHQLEVLNAYRSSASKTDAARKLGTTKSNICSALSKIRKKYNKRSANKEDEFDINAKVNELAGKYKQFVKKRRFNMIITSAQNSTPVHKEFMLNLQALSSEINAKILVIPFRYKNPTSNFVDNDRDYWAEELTPYLCEDDFDLCDNLSVLGNLKTQPTATRPLSGLETVSGDKSAIVGHTKLELKSVATPSSKLPKLLISTGCCTVPNYTDSKAGYKGGKRHSLSAIVAEVDGDLFFTRQVIADNKGGFIDLLNEYKQGEVRKASRPQVLSTGDLHAANADEMSINATFFDDDSMLKYFNPEYMTLDDTLDFQNGHHVRNDPIAQHTLLMSGAANILKELKLTFNLIDKMEHGDTKIIIKRSNHDEHFERWVKETDPRRDPLNARTWCMAFTAMLDGKDPYKYFASKMMKTFDKVRFLERDEPFVVGGVAHDGHGDKGANGSRGGLQAFTKLGCAGQWGHSHSAGIMDDQYQNGTNSKLRLSYNVGPSSWTHSNTIQYANGKRSLLFVINGKWRF